MRWTLSLSDISSKHVPLLTDILQFRPKEEHVDQGRRIKTGIKALPLSLRGPGRLIRFLLPSRIDACEWHKGLNRCVTDLILHQIQIEVGIRLNSLISHSHLLDSEQNARVSRLRELHALWLEPETFEKTFLIPAHRVPWTYQTGKCDGCILSCIAGNMQTLLDLRCVVRSRATSKHVAKHGNPRLQIWIDSWIDCMVTHLNDVTGQPVQIEGQISKNDEQATDLKRARAKIHSRRKKHLKAAGPDQAVRKPSGENAARPHDGDICAFEDKGEEIVSTKQARRKDIRAGEVDEDAPDVELSNLDAYSALMSSEHLPAKSGSPPQYVKPEVDSASNSTDVLGNEHYSRTTARTKSRGRRQSVQEEDVYVPPRQNWVKPAVPPDARASSITHHHRSTDQRKDSWESVVFDSNYVQSGIASSRQACQQRPARASSSCYASEIPRFASHQSTAPSGRPAGRGRAESYINVLPPFPEDSRRATREKPSRATSPPLATTVRDDSSSCISPKTRVPPRPFRNAPPSLGEDFKRVYDDLAKGMAHPGSPNLTSGMDISDESRAAMTPEGLMAAPKLAGRRPRTNDKHTHAGHEVSHRRGPDHITYRGTGRVSEVVPIGNKLATEIERETVARARRGGEPKRTGTNKRHDEKSPSTRRRAETTSAKGQEKLASNATTWEGGYIDELKRKPEVGWFYKK